MGRLIFVIGALAVAAQASADAWAEGSAAFERGDYAAALGFFEAARDAGAAGPAVHYNIAVCQYELERFTDAAGTFASIAREYPRMAGLADYNLGLASLRAALTRRIGTDWISWPSTGTRTTTPRTPSSATTGRR